MAQVLLSTSPHFRGTISNTPSGKIYYVLPGETITAEDADQTLLFSYGFSPAAPSASAAPSLTINDGQSGTVAAVATFTLQGVVVSGSSPNAIANMTTIVGSDVTVGTGQGITLKSGASTAVGGSGGDVMVSTGDGTKYGGYITLQSGKGSIGGGLGLHGGDASGTYAGNAIVSSGVGSNHAYHSGLNFGGGPTSYVALYGAGTKDSTPGQDVKITSGKSKGGGLPGEIELNADSSLIAFSHSWDVGDNPNGRTIGIASRRLWLTHVVANLDSANAGVSTMAPVKAASATSIASGTALTSDSVNCAGTPAANQSLTITATVANQFVESGERIGLVSSGTFALSAGNITLWFTPAQV